MVLGRHEPPEAGPPQTAAALFAIVWDVLTDVMGSAAAAAVIRKSAKHAAANRPPLAALRVERESFEYRCALPPGWDVDGPDAIGELHALVRALAPLLVELAGPVVVRRLDRSPQLRAAAISFVEEGS